MALFKANPSFSIPKPSLPYEILTIASSKDSGVDIEPTVSSNHEAGSSASQSALVSVVSSSCTDYNPESVEPELTVCMPSMEDIRTMRLEVSLICTVA